MIEYHKLLLADADILHDAMSELFGIAKRAPAKHKLELWNIALSDFKSNKSRATYGIIAKSLGVAVNDVPNKLIEYEMMKRQGAYLKAMLDCHHANRKLIS